MQETDQIDSMISMKNNKTPSNDRLTKKICRAFRNELNTPLTESVK